MTEQLGTCDEHMHKHIKLDGRLVPFPHRRSEYCIDWRPVVEGTATPPACPTCKSTDPNKPKVLYHPTEDAMCFDSWHEPVAEATPPALEFVETPTTEAEAAEEVASWFAHDMDPVAEATQSAPGETDCELYYAYDTIKDQFYVVEPQPVSAFALKSMQDAFDAQTRRWNSAKERLEAYAASESRSLRQQLEKEKDDWATFMRESGGLSWPTVLSCWEAVEEDLVEARQRIAELELQQPKDNQ